MKLIKQFFVWALLFNSIVLLGMELLVDQQKSIKQMHDFIDENYLGIDDDEYGKCLIGPFMSWFKSFYITQKQAADEMCVIENYISKTFDKHLMLTTIIEKHWYVAYLMQKLINAKLEEFKSVTGSTIDDLMSPTFAHVFEKIVWQHAYDLFLKHVSAHQIALFNISPDILQYTILFGHKCEVLHLAMSEDGKYLESIDYGNNKMLWDMRKGIKVDITCDAYDHIKWAQQMDSGYDGTCDENDNYYATTQVNTMNINENIYPHIKYASEDRVIYLFKRPTAMEYACQKAFKNSANISFEELIHLRKSDSIQLITGFVKDNFESCFKDYLSDIK